MSEVLIPNTGLVVSWVEFLDSSLGFNAWSMQGLVDPETWYGGFKEQRVTEMAQLVRALSDINGTYQGADFAVELSDFDLRLRSMLAGQSTRFFLNRSLIVRMIDDVSRRLGLQARTVMRGLVADYRPLPDLKFRFGVQDVITRRFSSQVASLSQVPKRQIRLEDFPDCPPDTEFKPVPIIYGLVSDQNEYTGYIGTQPKFTAEANMGYINVGDPGSWSVKYVVTLVGEQTRRPPWASENQQDERVFGTIEFDDCIGPDEYVFGSRFTIIEWDQPINYGVKIYGRFRERSGAMVVPPAVPTGDPTTGSLAFEGGTFGYLGYIPKVDTGAASVRMGWTEAWLRSSEDDWQPPLNNMYVDGNFTPGGLVTIDNSTGVLQPIYVGPKRFL